MLVRRKADGQLGELPDNEFNPAEYEAVGASPAPQTQQQAPVVQSEPEQEVRKSLSQSIGEGALGILGNIYNPMANFANKALREQKEAVKRTKKGDLGSAVKEAAIATGRTFLSPEAGRAAAETASFALPFGKAGFVGSKFVAPGAAAGGLQSVAQGDSPTEVLGNVALGGVTGGAVQGAGAVLPKISQGAKKATTTLLDRGGKGLAIKGIKPSPSQQVNFYKDTGEKLDDFLTKRNLGGEGFDKIDEYTSNLQNQFDEVANQPGLVIESKAILSKFDQEIERLRKSILPADKRKAEALQGVRDNFIAKYGTNPLGADILTTLRRDVDAGIRDFQLDPAVKGPLNLTRDIIQNSIRESADQAGVKIEGKSLKELGTELSKLYKLQEIAERQQFVGQGTAPLGLTDLLGGTAGGAAAGIPGLVAGVVANKVLSSPKTLNVGSKALSGAAEKVARLPAIPSMGETGSQIAGQATRIPALAGQSAPADYNSNNNKSDQSFHTEGTIPQSYSNVNSSGEAVLPPISEYVTGQSPQAHAQAYQAALLANDTKAATQIKGLYEMEVQYQKDNQAKTNKPLSGPNSVLLNKAETATKALDRIETMLKDDPNLVLKKLNPLDQSGRQLGTDITSAIDLLGFFRTGATITTEQRKDYINLFPTVLDDEATRKMKLDALRAEFQGYVDGIMQAGGAESQEYQGTGYLPPI